MATAKIVELDESNTCRICDNALALYSCPKCNIIYCSLDCYQSATHLECSENFYKENIIEELNLGEGMKDMEAKMSEILKRTHDSNRILTPNIDEYGADPDILLGANDLDSDDDSDQLDIAERLAGVNLDDANEVWEKLTEYEKQDFVSFLKSEDVSKLIPSWDPWWKYYNDGRIEDLSESEKFKEKCPKMSNIQQFSQLTTKAPAESVKYNLINILAAYVFTMRYFNGECYDFTQEAVSCIISLSLTLKNAQNFEDFETAVKSVEQECANSNWVISDMENIQLMREDLDSLLKGPNPNEQNFFILCALSDINFLLNKSNKPSSEKNVNFAHKFPDEHFPTVKLESPSKIKIYCRKIEYYLSYVKEFYKK